MVRTRFAPSPTGFLHVGGARTALFSWAYARKHGGKFILRIEDTDLERSTQESVQAILDGMRWLKIDWDEGPFFQMQRLARYEKVAEDLVAAGHAYYDYMSREELEALRQQQIKNNQKPRYDGRWRPERAKALGLKIPQDVKPVVRFRTPEAGEVGWKDLVKGPIAFPNSELDDLVLLRADGVPTYNFGVVVDDLDMNITHVIRGDDHVNNTPRQIHIFRALKAKLPEFAHVPMILGADGERLSKRHGAVSVMQYSDDGFLPEALVNYLSRLGWSHGDDEVFDVKRFIEWFELEHISRSAAQFDPGKLRWLNHHYLKLRADAELAQLVAPRVEREGGKLAGGPPLESAVALLKERSETLETLAAEAMMFYGDVHPTPELLVTHITAEVRPALAELADAFSKIFDWQPETLTQAIQAVLGKYKLKMPKLAMPLRVMVFGLTQTPNLSSVLALAGKERVLSRMRRYLDQVEEKERLEYEERLQRRLVILSDQIKAGKIKFAKGLKVIESLQAVRYRPDGKVDLSTVDGLVRSLALAAEHVKNREDLKNAISLADIQRQYFEFIEGNFGHFYKEMRDRRLTPYQVAEAISKQQDAVEELVQPLPDFLSVLTQFWDALGDIVEIHLEDMHTALKGVFGGDLFPSSSENIASKCGLYADTIVLPDPFMRSKDLFPRWRPQQQAYYLIKHALNVLQYRELACADVNPPIVVILASRSSREEEQRKFFLQLGEHDSLIHAGKVFGREFASIEGLFEFCSALNTVDKVIEEVKDKKRVLFDTTREGDLRAQVIRATTDEHAQLLKTVNPGLIVGLQAMGRMGVSNELLFTARGLGGAPIIEAPTSWQYFVWKLEYDAEKLERETRLKDLHVVRGLQTVAENEMEWLGRVPPEALIEIRKQDAMGEIKQILGRGIEEIAHTNPANFHRTADQVFDNIQTAFAQHRSNVRELAAKGWKFAGSDIGSWIVVGSLTAAAAATADVGLAVAAWVADKTLDPPKLKEIPEKVRDLIETQKKIKRSPIGILFKYKEN
jgi:glutamyl-tRNA synthetase